MHRIKNSNIYYLHIHTLRTCVSFVSTPPTPLEVASTLNDKSNVLVQHANSSNLFASVRKTHNCIFLQGVSLEIFLLAKVFLE